MLSVESFREFTVRDMTRLPDDRSSDADVSIDDVLVFTKQGRTYILVLDSNMSYLKLFDADSWKCLSICVLENETYPHARLYQVSDIIYLFCHYGRILRVTSTDPLEVQVHGRTYEEYLYHDVCALDSETLIAVSVVLKRVDLISTTGQFLQRVTTDHEWSGPCSVSVHASGSILTVIDKPLWNQDGKSHVVCMSVSESRSLSLKWISQPMVWHRNPVIASGVVIGPCNNSSNYPDSGYAVLVLSLESGRQLMKFSIPLVLHPEISNAICVYAKRLFIGCQGTNGLVEFQLTGELTCIHPICH
jgi:hypothetical protein